MKKSLIMTLAIFGVMAASPPKAKGQVPSKPVDLYLGGGISVPSGDLAELWKLGFHGTGRIGFSLAPRLDILFGVDFNRFGLDVPSSVTGISGGDISTFQFAGDLKVNLGVPMAPVNPYLIGGIGVGVVSFSDISNQFFGTLSLESVTRFFFEVGGGVEYSRIFIQAKIVSIAPGEGSVTHFPITFGVML